MDLCNQNLTIRCARVNASIGYDRSQTNGQGGEGNSKVRTKIDA